jgi:hypothetical protein
MKKTLAIIFFVLSSFLLILAGNVTAYNGAYTHINYMSSTVPTINGQYTTGDEWGSSLVQPFGTNGFWRDEWTMGDQVYANLLIETADDTDDAGDYWVVCFDSTAAGGEAPPNGGTAPQTDDYKVVITGHGASASVQWYKGTGTAWNAVSSPPETVFAQAQSLSSSPKISAPHYILEMHIEKQSTVMGTVIMGYNWAQYVAYYDAHTGGYGLQSWPPASASGSPDVPDSWGYIPYEMAANPSPDVPESLGLIVVLSLSFAAFLVGTVLLRKQPKTAKISKL